MSMECVTRSDSSQVSPTPKLSLFSLPHYTPPDTQTPPFQTPASVPFKWEVAPGKPLSGREEEPPAKPKAARCLLLPPGKITNSPSPSSEITNTPSPSSVLDVSKPSSFSFRKLLKGEGKITNTPSPSLILDGPNLGPSISKTMSFSFRKFLKGDGKMTNTPLGLDGPGLGLGLSPEEGLVWKLVEKEKVNLRSWRWGSEREFEEEGEGNFDFSSPFRGIEENGMRLRKRTGFWANIYKNVKQAVPWKRRQDKRRKMTI